MKIAKNTDLPENQETCCVKTAVKQLVSEETHGCDLKLFIMHPSGYSPLHSHPAQHCVVILEGKGTVSNGKKATAIVSGDVINIASNEPHQFKATADIPLKFIAATFGNEE